MALDEQPTPTVGDSDLRVLLRQLVQQKWTVIGVFVAVMAATTFATLGATKIYEGTATLEYDPTPPRPLGSEVEDVVSGSVLAGKEWYQTQNAIVSSRTVGRKVVERFNLNRDPDFMRVKADERGGWQGTTIEEAVEKLLSNLTVRQERDTRVARVNVRDTNPERASLLANAISDAYMNWVMEERLGSTVRAVEWLSGQLDDVSRRLATSEHSLYDFRREHNVLSVSLADQQNGISQMLNSFRSALSEATTRRIRIEAKLKQLELVMADDPMTIHAGLVAESRAISELRTRYYEGMRERESLATKYGPNHPDVRRIQVQLDVITKGVRDEFQGLVDALRAELREAQDVERGLKQAKQQAQNDGLNLNLYEIDYNRLERERANNEKMHTLLLQRTTETGLTRMLRVSPVRMVDRAPVPKDPVFPRPLLNFAGGGLLGLLGGIGLAIFRVRMDRTVNTPDEIAAQGLTVLGLVPKIDLEKVESGGGRGLRRGSRRRGRRDPDSGRARDLIIHTNPRSSVAECCRTIRTNLSFMSTDHPLRTMLVTSPGPAEGKSTVAVSLAITMANSGRRVLLVDTDLRRPRIHKVFNLVARTGITSVLAGEAKLDECIQTCMVSGLFVLPCGPVPPNPSELLHTARFKNLLATLQENFDLVIFDSPPVGVVIDAAIIGPQLDGAVIVAEAGRTTRDALVHARRQMSDVGSKLLGCVLNEFDFSKQGSYGAYYYAGEYYYANPNDAGLPPSDGEGPASSSGAAPVPH